MSSRALSKILVFWVLFVILHYAYAWFGHPALTIVSQTRETFFQHAKIGLFAYALVSGSELLLRRRSGNGSPLTESLIWSRVLSTLLLPWVMFILYYTGPAFYGRPMPSIPIEIAYANIVLLAVAVVLILFENSVEQAKFTAPARAIVLLLLTLAVAEMIIFSYRLPWATFF